MKNTIFFLERRGANFIFHFVVYNLGGLYHILNGDYFSGPEPFYDSSKIVSRPTGEISFPIKILMDKNDTKISYVKEAFELIKDKFQLVENLEDEGDYEIVSIFGADCRTRGTCDNPYTIYPFLRNLFFEYCKFDLVKGKRIYITRKNAASNHGRVVMNEEQLEPLFKKHNIEYIQLENYSFLDKIRLFMESEIIISTTGGQLTFSIFSNPKARIIEIDRHYVQRYFIEIANVFSLNHVKCDKYQSIDIIDNCIVNVEDFSNYIDEVVNQISNSDNIGL